MKKIIYPFNKTYLLTDKEFQEAKIIWTEKNSYSCKRLEAELSNKYVFAETPRDDLDCEEVFIAGIGSDGDIKKVYKRGGKYCYGIVGEDGDGCRYAKFIPTKEQLASFVNQEDFYQEKKYLSKTLPKLLKEK